jgi:hypothetical protein
MKKCIFYACACTVMLCLAYTHGHAQFLKKLKDKVAQKVADAAGANTSTNTNNQGNTGTTGNGNGSPANTTGAGLKNTAPPDVEQNINSAEKATGTADYSSARFALQQAMTGVEIELGRQLLKSLPATVDGLAKDTTQNLVQSLQYGWANLTIQTVYSDGKNKQFKITIGNMPAYSAAIGMYFNNQYMMQNNGGDQKVKQIMVKGNKAIIQFDQSTGYQVFMQLGQSSMIAWECVNFATEDEVMGAVNSFDVDGIKKMMGEQ